MSHFLTKKCLSDTSLVHIVGILIIISVALSFLVLSRVLTYNVCVNFVALALVSLLEVKACSCDIRLQGPPSFLYVDTCQPYSLTIGAQLSFPLSQTYI